ncbi:MAG TPA: DUF4276 family protein [Longimicrobium sp.]|jgi:hypothetical protein
MRSIVMFVEGEGDEAAVPVLLTRILHKLARYDWIANRTIRVGSLDKFISRMEDYLRYIEQDPKCAGALVLLDLDDGCPRSAAHALTERLRAYNAAFPIAVVFAHREYEAWFLASMWSLSLNATISEQRLDYPGEPEARRDAKGWISQQMGSGRAYKERINQAQFTRKMSMRRAYKRSRSFRRLCAAVRELVELADRGDRGLVTPAAERTVPDAQ